MIDSGKIVAAARILEGIPGEKPEQVNIVRDSTYASFDFEYSDHSIGFRIDHNAADPYPYIDLLYQGKDLLRYFVEKSIVLNREKEELLLAFKVTFNSLIDEVSELKQRISELEERENE